jgi:hypothetical protein
VIANDMQHFAIDGDIKIAISTASELQFWLVVIAIRTQRIASDGNANGH